ncbi:hypothetical protein B0F87_104311 [Methylobacter tundripaludum]|uniref:Secreted protein n=1 Tax=Methylobacter tundripaludum TaxID=173365 RepID=A0A2S6HFF3_9GAMM|nr:hypothetical protein [Methylobacter tundripaludum]PPK76219.1 hypothetical protein B0F87_104311 [Methylobacter tundripaludum]
MELLIAFILAANFLTSPCAAAQTSATNTTVVDNLAGMRWLKVANPETYYREDIAKRQFRFFEVLGYSSEILEVGNLTYSRCYAAKIQLDRIEGTTDMPRSLEYGELNNKASVFAKAYNKLMKSYADSHGLSNCRAGTDWDEAVDKIDDYVWGESQDEGLVGYDDAGSTVTLKIDLKDPARAKSVVTFACKRLKKHKITETVNVEIAEWLPGPGYHVRKLSTWACKSGSIVTP